MSYTTPGHDLGIQGELSEKQFEISSANGWRVELKIERLDELIFVLHDLRRARNSARYFQEHNRFRGGNEIYGCLSREERAKLMKEIGIGGECLVDGKRVKLESFNEGAGIYRFVDGKRVFSVSDEPFAKGFSVMEPVQNECPVCRFLNNGGPEGHVGEHIGQQIEGQRHEGQYIAAQRMRKWAASVPEPTSSTILKMCDELLCSFELDSMRKNWTPSQVQQESRAIEKEILLRAADAICPGCKKHMHESHACKALPIRQILGRIDPDGEWISPRDWAPSPKA